MAKPRRSVVIQFGNQKFRYLKCCLMYEKAHVHFVLLFKNIFALICTSWASSWGMMQYLTGGHLSALQPFSGGGASQLLPSNPWQRCHTDVSWIAHPVPLPPCPGATRRVAIRNNSVANGGGNWGLHQHRRAGLISKVLLSWEFTSGHKGRRKCDLKPVLF